MVVDMGMIETDIDRLIYLIDQSKELSVTSAAEALSVTPQLVDEWADSLEEAGVIKIKTKLHDRFLICPKHDLYTQNAKRFCKDLRKSTNGTSTATERILLEKEKEFSGKLKEYEKKLKQYSNVEKLKLEADRKFKLATEKELRFAKMVQKYDKRISTFDKRQKELDAKAIALKQLEVRVLKEREFLDDNQERFTKEKKELNSLTKKLEVEKKSISTGRAELAKRITETKIRLKGISETERRTEQKLKAARALTSEVELQKKDFNSRKLLLIRLQSELESEKSRLIVKHREMDNRLADISRRESSLLRTQTERIKTEDASIATKTDGKLMATIRDNFIVSLIKGGKQD